uniref:Uncharacterized protein n=1 Tax=Arundo donax TaxID=35708 RepID=A0A0A9GTD5_ARUDO
MVLLLQNFIVKCKLLHLHLKIFTVFLVQLNFIAQLDSFLFKLQARDVITLLCQCI